MPIPYPDLPASEYEYNGEMPVKTTLSKMKSFHDWNVPYPLELYASGVLKVPTKELNSCTYVLIKNICGLHFVSNRISIQTSVPCQGQLSHIMFICPAESRQKVVEFILRIIEHNKDV